MMMWRRELVARGHEIQAGRLVQAPGAAMTGSPKG